jgi:1,2-diacylglycerol 3-alpha-glucosyltransferase
MPRLLIHFARFGPYHHARLHSADKLLAPFGWEIIGIETAGTDSTYAWDETAGNSDGPKMITAFPGRVHEEITAQQCRRVLHPLLDSLDPAAIAIAGWASPDALTCLSWCRKNDRRRIVMSETREADGKRVWWKERIKRYLISRFDGALVGGRSHRDYLVKLGMPADKIRFGYNVVDNAYFAAEAAKWRGRESEHSSTFNSQLPPAISAALRFSTLSPPPYFLASNRFIERKNLSRLIEAYAVYLNSTSNIQHSTLVPWDLCLLGDGELKPALIAQCHRLGLHVEKCAPWESSLTLDSPASHLHLAPLGASGQTRLSSPTVYFPGFRQIEELPRFYAHAGCFVHPALEEPWGLVINEAMACGLPILSGSNVGAAEELVDDGINGFNFDAEDVEAMSACLARVVVLDEESRKRFGDASMRIVEQRCATQAFGQGLAQHVAELCLSRRG